MNKKLIGSIISIVAVIALIGVVAAGQKEDTNKTKNADTMSDGKAMNNDPTSPYASSSDQDTTAKSETESPSTQPTVVNKITIDDMAFGPTSLTVSKGTTVTWTNKDSVSHNVTGSGGKGPHSQPLNTGDSYSYTFNDAGTFDYICTFHSGMKAKVVVTE